VRRTERHDEATPLREFEWSESIVGMGFFPQEVDLPAEWTWSGTDNAPGTAPRRP
jgi:hypothetical protein